MILADVWVPGVPRTKGSLTFKGNGYVEENVAGSARWRVLVAERIRSWRAERDLIEPSEADIEIQLSFWMPAAPKTVRDPSPGATHERSGDIDKLSRNILDAAAADAKAASKNGGCYVNDVQVCRLIAAKYYADMFAMSPGARILVSEIERHRIISYAQDELHNILASARVGRL